MITIVMFVILLTVTVYVFRAVLLSWSGQEERAGIDIVLDRGIEEMVRDLREAKDVDFLNDDELRFTIEESGSDTYYAYYLYNENDVPYPPDFDEDAYILKKVELQNVVGGDLKTGTATYGTGRIIITDVLPPTTSDLSFDGTIVTIDLSVQRNDEIIRSRTEVKPRNL